MKQQDGTNDEQMLTLLADLLLRHGMPFRQDFRFALEWLDQRLTDYEAMRDEPLKQYGASRPETRSEGEFSGRLRERQAKSAQAAMMGMGLKLQEAHHEIDRLRAELDKTQSILRYSFGHILVRRPNGAYVLEEIPANEEDALPG